MQSQVNGTITCEERDSFIQRKACRRPATRFTIKSSFPIFRFAIVMTPLTAQLARSFSFAVRTRGQGYFHQGAVEIVDVGARSIRALVQGSSLYVVTVSWSSVDLSVEVECSCPYFNDRGLCKHIWATLLQVDSDDSIQEPELSPDKSGLEGRRQHEENGWPVSGKGPAKTLWRRQLDKIQASTVTPGASVVESRDEVVYIIDVEKTLKAGMLSIEVAERRLRKDGKWGKPRARRIPSNRIGQLPNPVDRQILSLLDGARDDTGPGSYSYDYPSYTSLRSRYRLPEAIQETLALLMCQSGHCFLRSEQEADPVPMRWDDQGKWEFELEISTDSVLAHFTVTGRLRRGEQSMPLSEPVLLTSGGLMFTTTSVARLEHHGAFAWIAMLRRDARIVVPAGQRGELFEALMLVPNPALLNLPAALKYEEVPVTPVPNLKLSRSRFPGERLHAELSFDYEGRLVEPDDPRHRFLGADGDRVIVRDLELESGARSLLGAVGFQQVYDSWRGTTSLQLAPSRLDRAVSTLTREGWRVEAEGRLYRSSSSFSVQVESNIDWFEVQGSLKFGDQKVALPELLHALKRGQDFIPLGDGSLGILPKEWLDRYGILGDLGVSQKDSLRFSRSQVVLIDALLASQPEASFDRVFEQARDQLRHFEGIRVVAEPASFSGRLRSYQREGLGWLEFLQEFGFGGCLADDMGLGKTVQVLALLEGRRLGVGHATNGKKATGRGRPAVSLVVVPRSIVYNWQQEAARFTPKLRVLDHTGLGRSRDAAAFDDYDLVITTYGTLRRDAAFLAKAQFDYVILDEAQAIKNPKTASAKAARLLQGNHRLALSGTPIENHLGELLSLFEFLNPGMLGQGSNSLGRLTGTRAPDPETLDLMAQALRPFILRRTKDEVARDLPPRTEQTIFCELRGKQRVLYDQLRDFYRQSLLKKIEEQGLNRSKIMVLEALLRLRQVACHPGLVDPQRVSDPSAKLDLLREQLTQVMDEGHKALVFSQFTSLLSLVRKHLDDEGISYEYLDGRTRKRAPRIEHFQSDPSCQLFLISLKAGGLGLNLTAADYVFLLDPWWNPAVEAQAIDRAHRIGQTRQVFAYRLIASDTVEEKILELQKSKRDLADAIITRDNSLIRNLRPEDLALLLS